MDFVVVYLFVLKGIMTHKPHRICLRAGYDVETITYTTDEDNLRQMSSTVT